MRREFTDASDAALVVSIGRYEQAALAEAYRRHAGATFGLAKRLLNDHARAEEVVQEVFVRLWNEPNRFDPERGTLRSYLLAHTHGRAVDLIRADTSRRNREEKEARQQATGGYDIAHEVWDIALAGHVRDAMEKLQQGEREAIELAYFGGLTYKEAADRLGEPEGTVKSRIRSGLKRLRAELVQAGVSVGSRLTMSGEQDDMAGRPGDTYELDELLGAYALDAVDDDERRRVEDYLEINPRAAAEVQAHREVATMLAFTGMDAPDDLWSRISDEIGEPAPPLGEELAKVISMDDRPRRRGISRVAPWIMTAAAAAVIGFVAIGLTDRADAPDEPLASAVDVALANPDSTTTQLVSDASEATADAVIDPDGHGFVLATGLPALSEDQTYQLWGVVESGDVISLGIFGPDPDVETFTVEGSVTALAITIEDYPGVISNGNPEGAFVGAF